MAGTMLDHTAGRTSTATTRGFISLMLITAGALVLAGRVLPVAGEALVLVLGVELLIWAWIARDDGPLIAGGVLSGVAPHHTATKTTRGGDASGVRSGRVLVRAVRRPPW